MGAESYDDGGRSRKREVPCVGHDGSNFCREFRIDQLCKRQDGADPREWRYVSIPRYPHLDDAPVIPMSVCSPHHRVDEKPFGNWAFETRIRPCAPGYVVDQCVFRVHSAYRDKEVTVLIGCSGEDTLRVQEQLDYGCEVVSRVSPLHDDG